MGNTAEAWGAGWAPGVGHSWVSVAVSPEQGLGTRRQPTGWMVTSMRHVGQAAVRSYVVKQQPRGCCEGMSRFFFFG